MLLKGGSGPMSDVEKMREVDSLRTLETAGAVAAGVAAWVGTALTLDNMMDHKSWLETPEGRAESEAEALGKATKKANTGGHGGRI